MAYIANRPCRFGGNQFFIGDIVPDELIGNPETQVKRGIISMAASVAAKSTAAVPEADKATAAVPEADKATAAVPEADTAAVPEADKATAAVPEADKATAETSKARSGKRARRAGDADGSNV